MRRFDIAAGVMRAATMALLVVLVGCATQLAPPYDKNVADGLVTASSDAMSLLSEASTGTKPEDYHKREGKYSDVIGKFETLAILAASRPMPKNNFIEKVNESLQQRGVITLADDSDMPPSVHAIKKVSEAFELMRNTDRVQGITATEAKAFKGQVAVYLDQAITYENFLNR